MKSPLSIANSPYPNPISNKEPLVLVLSGAKGDTRRYRIFHAFEQLNLMGVSCMLSHITEGNLLTKIRHASLVIFHRVTYDRYVERILQTIREQETLPIFDADDLTFKPEAFQWIDSPDFQDPIRATLYKENMRRTWQTLDQCAAALTSTAYLSKQVRSLGKPAWIHRNAFSQEMLDISEFAYRSVKKPGDRLVIGYASGTATHNRDFDLLKLVLLQVLKRHRNAELWIIGPLELSSGWEEVGNQVRRFPLLHWTQLPDRLAQFSINLAPLVVDNAFAQSKSEIKYMEAALVRVPTVASPTEAFQYAIDSGQNGSIAGNQQEWIETLEGLIENPGLRKDMGEQAYQDAVCRYHPAVRSAELIDTLNQIAQSVSAKSADQANRRPIKTPIEIIPNPAHQKVWFADPELDKQPTLSRMAFYSLRYRSLWTMLKQIWIFFRRLIVPIIPYQKNWRRRFADDDR